MTDAVRAELARLQPQLLRFAVLQLRSSAAAEDAVQETMLAALSNAAQFRGAASVKTWIFSILRNKIIDELRQRQRTEPVDFGDAGEDSFADAFDESGHWQEPPARWGNPEAALEQKRFWEIFELCLEALPEKPARVFMMREFLGLATEEICKELAITASNCWVLLHRARNGLRLCLDHRWFGNGGGEGV